MKHRIPLILLLLATLLTFHGVARLDFVAWDDDILIYENPYLNPVTPSHTLHFWQHPYRMLYMPLTYSVWAGLASSAHLPSERRTADAYASSLKAWPFHVTNLLLHLCNVLMVFLLLRLFIQSSWAVALGTALFALHPVQVESVAWASEMKGLLSAFFSLLALYWYCLYARKSHHQDFSGNWKTLYFQKYYGLACFALTLALLSKPSAVAIPLVAGAFDRWAIGRSPRHIALSLIPWLLLALSTVLMAHFAQPIASENVIPIVTRPIVALDAIGFYARHLLYPFPLGIDYGRTPPKALVSPWLFWNALLASIAALFIWKSARVGAWMKLAAAISILALLPVLGLVPFAFQKFSTVADRYLYLALLGPAIAMAWQLDRLLQKPQFTAKRAQTAALVVSLTLLLVLARLSAMQIPHWANSSRLYQQALTVNPDSWLALTNLAVVKNQEGHREEAVSLLERALQINPRHADAHYALGYLMLEAGNQAEAGARFERTIQLQPDHANARYTLGLLRLRQGKPEEAIQQFQQAVFFWPEFAEAHNNLGMVLARQHRLAEAIPHWETALRIKPAYASAHYNLGLANLEQGNSPVAIHHFQEALRIDENFLPARKALQVAQRQSIGTLPP